MTVISLQGVFCHFFSQHDAQQACTINGFQLPKENESSFEHDDLGNAEIGIFVGVGDFSGGCDMEGIM